MMMFPLVLTVLVVVFSQLYNAFVFKPRKLRSKLQTQGIKGPSPSSLLYGNIPEIRAIQLQTAKNMQDSVSSAISHSWPASVFPHIEQWRNEYGSVFIYSTGSIQFLCITDPEKAKEISLCTSLNLGKPSYLSTERGPLLGKGVLSSNGTYWVHQRKIIAPEFYLDKIKVMVNLMVESTTEMLKSWERKALSCGENVEISIDEDMRALSADIISRASFGSNYTEGERIFSKLRTLQNVMSSSKVGVPGLRHIPNAHNREVWRLEKEIETEILNIVQARSGSKCERNLLKAIFEAANILKENGDLPEDIDSNKFIVDNCKNIYFAGHETTAISASWCLLLLAAHPEWQVRAREEVIQICGDNIPDADMLRRMKVLTMVIQETLRLYPPAAFVVREALQDISLKGMQVPKGVNIQIPIPVLHQHPELWGSDVTEFNPARFEGGIAKACKSPQAYMPFGVGTRTCVGQHFAMMELKIMLSLILSNFSLSLAPSYKHCPAFKFVVQPGYGVHLNIKHLFE
ncbi:hypothetical protein Leryth_014133 [Lithospermum erythrorhizon]|nr:hypothetical protein Leryth_014133 [Lithospermum erythrorhizon]